MKIVILGDYPSTPDVVTGGVEAVIVYLVGALRNFPDLKLDVITLSERGTEKRTVQERGVTIHYFPRSSLPSRLSIMDNIHKMGAELRKLEPDLLHAHVAGEFAEVAARSGLPWVLTLHGIRYLDAALRPGLINRYRGWFMRREELHAVQIADSVISINPFIQDTFGACLPDQIYHIENPVSQSFYELQQTGTPGQILFAGRLLRLKGIHILLQAFAELIRRIPGATLRLAGGAHSRAYSESYYTQLRQFVTEAGLEESVTFLGQIDEPAILQEYADCSVLALSSFLETSPMVIQQAMAAGKPVVSTDAGGVRYLVEDGDTGYIVPKGDPQALAEALYLTLSNQPKSRAMGQRGRQWARQRFRADIVATRTRDVYYNLLGQKAPPA